jgi:transketolase
MGKASEGASMNDQAIKLPSLIKLAKAAAQDSRIAAIKMTSASKSSHIGACLSVIDLLASLFTLKFNVEEMSNDNVILSKGHAAAALYAVLNHFGALNTNLDDYCKDGSKIYGHVNHEASPHIPLSTGSLGHGLPFALGVALALKLNGESSRTFVVISDGELNEGTTWESALVAAHHNLTNLVVLIDRNQIQSLGFTENTVKLEPIGEKWAAFGWESIEVDGHNFEEILKAAMEDSNKPRCVIANTVKGKGVSFMENKIEWHYKSASPEELTSAISEISGIKF